MNNENATMEHRMTAAEVWIKGHEKLCAERYGSLRSDLKWILRGIVGLLLGVTAWLAIQLWTGSQARLAALELSAGERAATTDRAHN
jgi:hypothetical protein